MSVSSRDIQRCISNDQLHLILMPTEACNLRCTYCYEDFCLGRMAPEVVSGVKMLIERRAAGLHLLSLSWFGGEPLLAMDVIEDVHGHVRQLQQTFPGLELEADITTNAYTLSRTRAARLLELGVGAFQIAFDGPRETHDQRRLRANGGSTFETIWNNLRALQSLPGTFRVTVRLHVDRETLNTAPRFLRAFRAQFGSDSRFCLYIRALSRLGGPQDSALDVLAGKDGLAALEALRARARRLGIHVLDSSGMRTVCYASHGNSFLIRANGRVNKCTVALDHPNNDVGRILADGRLHLDSEKVSMWMRGLWEQDEELLRCPKSGYAEPGADIVQLDTSRVRRDAPHR